MWNTLPLMKVYIPECSSARHEPYPAIIESDIVLPIWLELPFFTISIKLLFMQSCLGYFLNKAWYDKTILITLGTPYDKGGPGKYHTTVVQYMLILGI